MLDNLCLVLLDQTLDDNSLHQFMLLLKPFGLNLGQERIRLHWDGFLVGTLRLNLSVVVQAHFDHLVLTPLGKSKGIASESDKDTTDLIQLIQDTHLCPFQELIKVASAPLAKNSRTELYCL